MLLLIRIVQLGNIPLFLFLGCAKSVVWTDLVRTWLPPIAMIVVILTSCAALGLVIILMDLAIKKLYPAFHKTILSSLQVNDWMAPLFGHLVLVLNIFFHFHLVFANLTFVVPFKSLNKRSFRSIMRQLLAIDGWLGIKPNRWSSLLISILHLTLSFSLVMPIKTNFLKLAFSVEAPKHLIDAVLLCTCHSLFHRHCQ